MKLVKMNVLTDHAAENGYAIPAINIHGYKSALTYFRALGEMDSPAIFQTTVKTGIRCGSEIAAKNLILEAAAEADREDIAEIPFAINADHADFDRVVVCLRNGWTGVMYDGSKLPYEENVEKTEYLAKLAHDVFEVPIEAELGKLGAGEVIAKIDQAWSDKSAAYDAIDEYVENEQKRESLKQLYNENSEQAKTQVKRIASAPYLTDPQEARDFVSETGIDLLAPAWGSKHGAFKFAGGEKPILFPERVIEIAGYVSIPLVGHGTSRVMPQEVKIAEKYGAKLGGAVGVPDEIIRTVIKEGRMAKVNLDTDFRIAYQAGDRQFKAEHPHEIDFRKAEEAAFRRVAITLKEKTRVLGSTGKAGDILSKL